jgi:hypothetical protein
MRTSPNSLFIEQTSLPVNRFEARLAEELDQRTEFAWTTSVSDSVDTSTGDNKVTVTISKTW